MHKDPVALMVLNDADVQRIAAVPNPETGMGVSVVETDEGLIAVIENGAALPCYSSTQFYDLADLLAGVPAPALGQPNFSLPSNFTVAANRRQVAKGLTQAQPKIQSVPSGAHPLLTRIILSQDTAFFRYSASSTNHRFQNGNLTVGTYLTTTLERKLVESGYAAVGRFSLPLPTAACNVFECILPKGSTIDVGTVAPLFGQSGGGVEVCVVSSASAVQVVQSPVPPY